MATIDRIKEELDPRKLGEIAEAHDAARLSYVLESNTVEDMQAFTVLIGDYLNHHYEKCFGSRLPEFQAQEQAKEIVERVFRKRGGNLLSAYHQANTGFQGGVRRMLDGVADDIRDEAIRRYTNHVLDTYISPEAWPERVAIIQELLNALGVSSTDREHPERYASDYKRLVEVYLKNLRDTESAFFRL